MIAKYFLAIFALTAAQCAYGDVIGTLFAAGNSGGVGSTPMLNIEVLNPSGITIRSVDINNRGGQQDGLNVALDIYITPSTYVGNELNSAAWTLVASGTGVGAPENTPIPVDVTDFFLAQGTYGIAFNGVNINQGYTNGSNTYSNADVILTTGASTNGLFGPGVNSPRTWNGNIYYDIGASAVPEPSSFALFGLGFAGLGLSRRLQSRKQR